MARKLSGIFSVTVLIALAISSTIALTMPKAAKSEGEFKTYLPVITSDNGAPDWWTVESNGMVLSTEDGSLVGNCIDDRCLFQIADTFSIDENYPVVFTSKYGKATMNLEGDYYNPTSEQVKWFVDKNEGLFLYDGTYLLWFQ